jgi:hypothetical protein
MSGFNSLPISSNNSINLPIDGVLIWEAINPADTNAVMTTINAAIAYVIAQGKTVVNVQYSFAFNSTNQKGYSGIVSYSNQIPGPINQASLVQFNSIDNQNNYTNTLITSINVSLVVYGAVVLEPGEYSVSGNTLILNTVFPIESGHLITVFLT